jgi:hypothetical protein
MSTRRRSRQRHITSTTAHPGVMSSGDLVPVVSHERRAAANEDSLVAPTSRIVNPLWMVTGALGFLFALLAILTMTG